MGSETAFQERPTDCKARRRRWFSLSHIGWIAGMALALIGSAPDAAWADGGTGLEFASTDHTGRYVTDQDSRGKFILVYFGYT